MSYLALLALMAGAAISVQASMNAQLGVLLKSPLIGTTVAFSFSCLFTLAAVIASTRHYPQADAIRSVPVYLWFTGGALSALGVGLFYYLIPKMGIGPMMSYALAGQIVIAMIVSHFGWFELPVRPLNAARFAGLVALINGIILINWE
jgi:transporter family-2 protein